MKGSDKEVCVRENGVWVGVTWRAGPKTPSMEKEMGNMKKERFTQTGYVPGQQG